MLNMIEDDFFDRDFVLTGPVHAMRTVSHDPSLQAVLGLADGTSATALELQWEFLRLARKYADERGHEACGGEAIGEFDGVAGVFAGCDRRAIGELRLDLLRS